MDSITYIIFKASKHFSPLSRVRSVPASVVVVAVVTVTAAVALVAGHALVTRLRAGGVLC